MLSKLIVQAAHLYAMPGKEKILLAHTNLTPTLTHLALTI